MKLQVPESLHWLRASSEGEAWLDGLPAAIASYRQRWDLELGEPYPDSYVSLVLPAGDRVLKIQFPGRESGAEGAALRAWGGQGAIRLIDQHENALLLERCLPGTYLAAAGPHVALETLTALLPRLWIQTGEPIGSVASEVERWIANLPIEYAQAGRPFEPDLLETAIATLQQLALTQGEQVLVHQDLHGHNVLAAAREPWLVIDPKPLLAEREFGLSPIIRSAELGHSRRDVLHRLDTLTRQLRLDRDRARLWAFGHTIAWGFANGKVLDRHIEIARWLLAG